MQALGPAGPHMNLCGLRRALSSLALPMRWLGRAGGRLFETFSNRLRNERYVMQVLATYAMAYSDRMLAGSPIAAGGGGFTMSHAESAKPSCASMGLFPIAHHPGSDRGSVRRW